MIVWSIDVFIAIDHIRITGEHVFIAKVSPVRMSLSPMTSY